MNIKISVLQVRMCNKKGSKRDVMGMFPGKWRWSDWHPPDTPKGGNWTKGVVAQRVEKLHQGTLNSSDPSVLFYSIERRPENQ